MIGVHIAVIESFMAGIGSWDWQGIDCKIPVLHLELIVVDHITKGGFTVLCHLNMKVRDTRGYSLILRCALHILKKTVK